MGKNSNAPAPDPAIGIAAERQAALGEDYLNFTKEQAKITNNWAEQDRAHFDNNFRPAEEAFVNEAASYDTTARREREAAKARTSVAFEATQAAEAEARSLAASGVDPRSGRSKAAGNRRSLAVGLAQVGADNTARQRVEDIGDAKKADVINLGRGYATNPLSSMSASNGTTQAGVTTAMSGQQAKAGVLQNQHGMQMEAYRANQARTSGLFGALGTVAGAAIMSSKDAKITHGNAEKRSLDAVMDMEVDKWTYKEGAGDGGTHVGPYAEDFQRTTGLGDGRTINMIDMLGTTMGAVKELGAKVDKLSKGRSLAGAA